MQKGVVASADYYSHLSDSPTSEYSSADSYFPFVKHFVISSGPALFKVDDKTGLSRNSRIQQLLFAKHCFLSC